MSVSFATPADFSARYDDRTLAQLCSDTGTAGTTATDPNIQVCLDDGAGEIVAACTVGQQYTESDLRGLTGASAAHLKRINCDLAMRYVADRRVFHRVNETLEKIFDRAEKYLERLQKGEAIFGVDANLAASVPSVTGPTTATLESLFTIRRRTLHTYPQTILPGDR